MALEADEDAFDEVAYDPTMVEKVNRANTKIEVLRMTLCRSDIKPEDVLLFATSWANFILEEIRH